MLDCRPGVVVAESVLVIVGAESVNEISIEELRTSANPMNGFLKFDVWQSSVPDRRAASLATFANEDIAFLQTVPLEFVVLEGHLLEVRRVDFKPTDIRVAKIGERSPLVLLRVEHLSQASICHLSKAYRTPAPWEG
jgi:hypothetical protein